MSSLASLKHHAEEDLSVPNGWKKFHGCKMKSCVENQIGEIVLEAGNLSGIVRRKREMSSSMALIFRLFPRLSEILGGFSFATLV